MADGRAAPFDSYAELLEALLAGRERACERIERRLLNVKDKPASRIRDRRYFDETLASCVFEELPRDRAALCEQLAAARLADGFEPYLQRSASQELDAAALVVRAYAYWNGSRWPGTSARLQYARTLWSVFFLRRLEDLSFRIWDENGTGAPPRLRVIQRLLDALNTAVPSAALVRDARWLLHTALGPLTRDLAPYFRVAGLISQSFTDGDQIEIHAAGAKLAGGHLRSQLRFRAAELGRSTASIEAIAMTRNSNSMDLALLVWDLVPLLDAYKAACAADDQNARLRLADAIFQGCAADPELLVSRLDLLGASTMIETVFVHRENGRCRYTAIGDAHVALLHRHASLLDDVAPALAGDASSFDPASAGYSPLGLEYGFCGDLLSRMAFDAIDGQTTSDVTLEDLFVRDGDATGKRARLVHEPSLDWARDVYGRTVRSLIERADNRGRANASQAPSATLFVSAEGRATGEPQDYCVTSDVTLALATGATAFPRGQIAIDRAEGRFLASAETDGRWFGVSKAVLTERIGRGLDAEATGVPQDVCDILRLTCPALIRERP